MTATATETRQARAQASSRNNPRFLRIHERQIAFMPNASFAEDGEEIDWLANPRLKAVEEEDAVEHSPKVKGLPAHLMRMCETPIMTANEERAFFRRMNYLKFRANEIRANLDGDHASRKQLNEVENLLERAERLRNYIIQANVRLVMSIAKKFADVKNIFDDVLSEGLTSLMRTVEKFDYDRGFRFSTYATTSIQRDLCRLVMKDKKQRSRFSTGSEDVFAACPEEETAPHRRDSEAQTTYDSLMEMIDQLDPRERLIIRSRFGFDTEGGRKQTYTTLGKQLGISKERVRQLAERAVSKLQTIAPKYGISGLGL